MAEGRHDQALSDLGMAELQLQSLSADEFANGEIVALRERAQALRQQIP
jgi:hypothetical protein